MKIHLAAHFALHTFVYVPIYSKQNFTPQRFECAGWLGTLRVSACSTVMLLLSFYHPECLYPQKLLLLPGWAQRDLGEAFPVTLGSLIHARGLGNNLPAPSPFANSQQAW